MFVSLLHCLYFLIHIIHPSYDNDEDNRQYTGISIISHTKHKNSGNRATGRSDKG